MTRTQCELRDWLIPHLLIDNSGRRGIASGIKVIEFKAAVIYLGTEDLACYRILVRDHKTAGVHGAAVVWVYDDLYKLMDMYLLYEANSLQQLPRRLAVFLFQVVGCH